MYSKIRSSAATRVVVDLATSERNLAVRVVTRIEIRGSPKRLPAAVLLEKRASFCPRFRGERFEVGPQTAARP